MALDYPIPREPITYQMGKLASLIGCDCKNFRPVTIAAKNTLAASTSTQTLFTYQVPPNITFLMTRISARFIPTPNDASLGPGDFRSGDVEGQGGSLAWVKVKSQSKTGETTTYLALLNHEFFIAIEAGATITIIIQRASATTPPTEVSLIALDGYFLPPQTLECITRAQGSIDEANPPTVTPSGLPAFFAVTLGLPQAVGSASLTSTFGSGRLLLFPTSIPESVTIDRVTIENTSADATASATIALFNSSKTLLVQGNTGALSTTGRKTITLSSTSLAAGFYWAAFIEVTAQVNWRVHDEISTLNTIKIMNADNAKVFIGDGGAVVGPSAPSTFSSIAAPGYVTGNELKIPLIYFWSSSAV